jgi:hypothetical protein
MTSPSLKVELEHRAEWAVRYAALRWPILPTHGVDQLGVCTCGYSRCTRPAKHPARTNYAAMATTDPALLRSYWRVVPFNLSLHIPERLLVLDVDDLTVLDALTRFGAWPTTATHTTTRGIRMFFGWAASEVAPTVHGLDGIKLDVLGTGALCILPPSVAASGHRYTWREGEAPWDAPLASVPDAFAAHVQRTAIRRAARTPLAADLCTVDGAIALARRRARYAANTSNGVGRGAAGLSRTLKEAGASPAIQTAALDVFHAEAGR